MEKGVQRILMPAIDAATHPLMLATETEWPACTAMMGLHPCSVNETYKQELEVVETYLKNGNLLPLGRLGWTFTGAQLSINNNTKRLKRRSGGLNSMTFL
jgi:TatD DNase family protein